MDRDEDGVLLRVLLRNEPGGLKEFDLGRG